MVGVDCDIINSLIRKHLRKLIKLKEGLEPGFQI